MSITHLELENFKSLEKASLDLGTVTLIIGSNGTGKSSFLQALGLLKQSRQQQNFVWNGLEVKSGAFADVVSFGATKRQIRFGLDIEATLPDFISENTSEKVYTCKYEFTIDNYGPVRQEGEYNLAGKIIRGSFDFKTLRGTVTPNLLHEGVRLGFPGPVIGSVLYTDVHDSKIFEEVSQLRNIILDSLESTFTVPVDRGLKNLGYAQKIAPVDFRSPEDVANFLVYKQDARQLISTWASTVLGESIEINFHRVEADQLSIEILRNKESINIAHEGAGLQHLLWPLAQLAVAPQSSVIAIEEPEIHLHPYAQAKLSEVLSYASKTQNKQILITTQSEHLLLGFLTQVAEHKLEAKELSIYYCEKVGATSQAIRLPVSINGTVEGGLRGFFEANFDEMSRYLNAQTEGSR
jgi:predicted ATPase